MKLKIKTSKNGRRVVSFIILMAALMYSGFTLKAQTPFSRETYMTTATNEQVTPESITNMTVTALEQKVFIEFTVVGQTEKCTFYLERSLNGTDYVVIAQKKGYVPSDPSKAVSYNFTDNKPVNGTAYYKVMQMKENGVAYSEVQPAVYNNSTQPLLTKNEEDQ
jgi:uncharacterized protein YxeA